VKERNVKYRVPAQGGGWVTQRALRYEMRIGKQVVAIEMTGNPSRHAIATALLSTLRPDFYAHIRAHAHLRAHKQELQS
jgi:hypothetical protein